MLTITRRSGSAIDFGQSSIGKDMADIVEVDDSDAAKSAIVIIEPRQFMRECLAQCLSVASLDHKVVAFDSIEQWDQSPIGHAEGDMVLLYHTHRSGSHASTSRIDALAARADAGFNLVLICDSDDPNEVVELVGKGVKGYIPTSVGLKVAIEALRLVWAGGVFVPANSLLKQRGGVEDAGPAEPTSQFTPRQAAVLEQLQQGKANKIIAFNLEMKESTVKVHVRNIMRKVGASNRTEVAVRALHARPLGRS